MRRTWTALVLAGGMLGCGAQVEESRFPVAEPRMPMVTYYDPVPQSPLGPTIREGAIAQDPQNPGGEAPI